MTEAPDVTSTDVALTTRYPVAWGLHDHAAGDLIAELGRVLVAASGTRTGDRILDVAPDVGGPAARPWVEPLPYDDGTFDVVLSCLGVLFTPHHQPAADELVRVCRPGGTIGLLSWTPRGLVGDLFRTTKPYAPPLPPGVQPAPMWGDEHHVRGMLGDRVTDVAARQETITTRRAPTPEARRDCWETVYGPGQAIHRHLGDDPDEIAALDRDLAAVAIRFDRGATCTLIDWEYLLLTARKKH